MSDPFKRAEFSAKLDRARAEGIPVMALRPDSEFSDEMDDVVIKNCDVHFEAMSRNCWWMACTFENGEEVVFHFTMEKNPKRIAVHVSETPDEWRDWDELYRQVHG